MKGDGMIKHFWQHESFDLSSNLYATIYDVCRTSECILCA